MGSIRKQGIQNTIISYLGIVIGFVNLLILQPYMLTAEEIGLTRILFSISVLFASFFPIGIGGMSIKYFPKFRNPENGHNGFLGFITLIAGVSYVFFGAIIFLLKGIILAQYENSPLFVEYFTYIFPMSFFMGFIAILNVYAFCLFKTSVPTFLSEVFIRLSFTVFISLYFLKLISFEWFARFYMISFGIQFVLLVIYILKVDTISFRINWQFVKSQQMYGMLKFTFLIALAAFASMALKNIDVTMLGSDLLKSPNPLNEVAIYAIGVTIGLIIETPANALGRIAEAKVSDAISRNDNKLIKEVYFQSTRLLMIIGGLLFVGMVVNIHALLQLLPEKYHAGETVVIIISISAFVNMATGMNSSMIYYSDKYVQGTYLLIGLIFTVIALNYFLIPIWGIEGAAVATGIGSFLFNAFKFALILRTYKLQPFGGYAFVVLFLMGSCFGINYFLPPLQNNIFDILYRSAIITLVYTGGVWGFKIAPEIQEFTRKFLKK